MKKRKERLSDYDFNNDDEILEDADSERDEKSELIKQKYNGTLDQETVAAKPLDTDLIAPGLENPRSYGRGDKTEG